MKLKGTIWSFGNNIDTDVIIPAKYLQLPSAAQLASHCLETIRPDFAGKVKGGDLIVAGANFGCGSSREHAPIAIKAAGVAAVIATSFSRIFFRNAINIGLPVIECPGLCQVVHDGDSLSVDLDSGHIRHEKSGSVFRIVPFPGFIKTIINHGGLLNFYQKELNDKPSARLDERLSNNYESITPEGIPVMSRESTISVNSIGLPAEVGNIQ